MDFIIKLENSYLYAEISEIGGELTRLYNKETKTELLWNGDPTYWKRHSPILFPNVGKTYQDTILIGKKSYPTSQHGFARDRQFTCVKSDDSFASFVLTSNEETKKVYPFDFELFITYTLYEKSLRVTWTVKNLSKEEMYFTIGGHPAFMFENANDKKENYLLYFPKKQDLTYLLLNPEFGTAMPDTTKQLHLENGFYPLSDTMFEKDALIFDDKQIEEVWLYRKSNRTPYVGLKCKDFNNFGIWSVKDAPFVCLEPWAGRCDDTGFTSDISEKKGINHLSSGETFEKEYEIVVGSF